MPDLPLFRDEADEAVAIYDSIRLPNVEDQPFLRDSDPWFRYVVAALFGSFDPVAKFRFIREIFVLAPKGSSKTTYGAALMLVAMLMCRRMRSDFLFVGPTQSVAEGAFGQAAGMIEADKVLSDRLEATEYNKTIKDKFTKCKLKIKTFDVNIMTGQKPLGVMLDELHLLGKDRHASQVLRQIRGGILKSQEGFLVATSTQSDTPPSGAFKDDLKVAREVRDGMLRGGTTLPVMYELPKDIASDRSKWSDPTNWHLVMPNLGRPVTIEDLIIDLENEKTKGDHAVIVWASQHLNLQVGLGDHANRWWGAEKWLERAKPELTFDEVLHRSEAIVVGIDGGGQYDLLGLVVMGRCRETQHWLVWSHGWCHESVLEDQKEIASLLRDFQEMGELTIVDDDLGDIKEIIDIIQKVMDAGLLAKVAVDPFGLGEMRQALADLGITQDEAGEGTLEGVPQGLGLMGALNTTARFVTRGQLWHSGSTLMNWCVGNLKIERMATAIRATKVAAGTSKIDLAMAMFDAAHAMEKRPEAVGASIYEDEDFLV